MRIRILDSSTGDELCDWYEPNAWPCFIGQRLTGFPNAPDDVWIIESVETSGFKLGVGPGTETVYVHLGQREVLEEPQDVEEG